MSFIDANRDELGFEPICQVLQVAPSTYLAAKARKPSSRVIGEVVTAMTLMTAQEAGPLHHGVTRCGRHPNAPARTLGVIR